MRIFVVLPFVLGLACTKHNPESCCTTQAQCDSFGLSGVTPCQGEQVCDTNGACIAPQCAASADCTDAATPFCENQVCIAACSTDDECAAMAGRPYCSSAGTCIACKDDSTCTAADAPVCDTTTNACRGCTKDSECASGICLESNGTCADAANAVFVEMGGADAGTCTQAAPCSTLTYAQEQMSGSRNVLKLLGNQYVVAGTQQLGISGYVDGTSTVITGSGSDGMFEVNFGDVVFTDVTLAAGDGHEVDVLGGQATFYGDTIGGTITTNGGSLTLDHAVATDVNCGVPFSGAPETPGTLNVLRSTAVLLESYGCPTSIQQSTLDNTSTPSYTGFVLDIEGSGASFHVDNSVIISANGNAFGAAVEGAAGGTFRFNTLVNLSGEDDMGEALNCQGGGGSYDVSNNIIAWHTSLTFACPVTYTLVDSLEGVPPGAGNQVGDVSTFFVDMTNKDFHLANGSPAIGAGSAEVDVTVDHDGNPRPNPVGSKPDVGAYESPM